MEARTRLVVLVSGNGSNLQAILDACAAGALPAEVVAVVSNKGGVVHRHGVREVKEAFKA
ncbi:MAG: formyltransferase family protein [Vicinamibacterales bacterium]|nr:formyltransferase family protein [Vicinamibacterales bacterium]